MCGQTWDREFGWEYYGVGGLGLMVGVVGRGQGVGGLSTTGPCFEHSAFMPMGLIV